MANQAQSIRQVLSADHNVEKKYMLDNLLKQSSLRFIKMRWLVPPTVLLGIAVGQFLGFTACWFELVLVTVFVALYNVIFHLLRRKVDGMDRHAVRRFTRFQIALDYVALFTMIHLSGGIVSPFLLFIGLHVILTAILLPYRTTYAFSLAAIVGVGLIAFLEYRGIIPTHHLLHEGLSIQLPYSVGYLLMMLCFFALSVAITAFLSTSIMRVLKDRVIQLSKSHEAIEALNHQRDRFMLQVTHNLKAPLAGTLSMFEVLLADYIGELNDKQRDYLTRVDVRMRTMMSMVQELLILARNRTEMREPRMEPVDFLEVARKICALYQDRAREKGLVFMFEAPQAPLMVEGDRDLLEQMLENLVSNAVKYTERGRVDVRLSETADGWAKIQIKDTGIGIPKEDLPNLTRDFFRAQNAKQRESFGTGLGLSLVKHTVAQHQGSLKVESQEGRGSTFTVKLPTMEKDGELEDQKEDPGPAEPRDMSGGEERTLFASALDEGETRQLDPAPSS